MDDDIAAITGENPFGLRVVLENRLFSPTERAELERLLTRILCDGLVAACAPAKLDERDAVAG